MQNSLVALQTEVRMSRWVRFILQDYVAGTDSTIKWLAINKKNLRSVKAVAVLRKISIGIWSENKNIHIYLVT